MDLESIPFNKLPHDQIPVFSPTLPLGLNIDRYIKATTLAEQSDNNISSSAIRANRT